MGAVAVTNYTAGDDLRRVYLREDSMLPISQVPLAHPDDEIAPAVWMVGAHGGAGCSTLAAMMAPMGDAGQLWPAADESPLCVLVCRSTKYGLERAHQAALQARAGEAGDVILLGIVVVDDSPGKCPKALERKISVMSDVFRIWRIPYLTDLRMAIPDECAQWTPGDEPVASPGLLSSTKKVAFTESVPAPIFAVAEEIFSSAAEAHELFG